MPNAAFTPCRARGCIGYAAAEGYCVRHQNARAEMNPPRERFERFDRLAVFQAGRAAWLMAHPLCFICGGPGNVLDHVIPHRGDRVLFFDQLNWQTLCIACHGRKTHQETRGQGYSEGGHLYVTMGAPGSGKSTYVARFPYVVSTDAARSLADRRSVSALFRNAFGLLAFHLAQKRTVALDTTADHPSIRAQALRIARNFHARTHLIVFDINLNDCIASQLNRADPVPNARVREVHESIKQQSQLIIREGWNEIESVTRNELIGAGRG